MTCPRGIQVGTTGSTWRLCASHAMSPFIGIGNWYSPCGRGAFNCPGTSSLFDCSAGKVLLALCLQTESDELADCFGTRRNTLVEAPVVDGLSLGG